MNHFYTSDEERVAKSVIDAKVRKAKTNVLSSQYWEFGHNFCVDCLRSSGVYLDCSHTVSVDEAQRLGSNRDYSRERRAINRDG